MNILYLTNELNQSDGVSGHLFYLLSELKKNHEINISIICGGGDAVNKFEKLGVSISLLKEFNHKNRSIKNFLHSVRFVNKFLKLNNIQILHSHNHYASNIAYCCSKISHVTTIQTIHGIFPEGGKLKHFKSQYFVTVNDHLKEHLLQKGVSDTKSIYLIHNGIDFNSNTLKKTSGKKKFIAASRLEKGKRLDVFIEAVSKLSNEYKSKAEFFIAGMGTLEEDFKKKNTMHNAGVKFLGNVPNLRELLNNTDIFVIPSEAEGFPITLLEAAASRNLIISSDFKGIDSILKDNQHGLIFKMNNSDDLHEKIKFTLENSELSEKLAAEFHNYAKDNFNSELMTDKHLSLYSEIVNNSDN
ncbi:MAG: glycosyltransferase family 4 protein [Ignavibacteriaceae bacterium]